MRQTLIIGLFQLKCTMSLSDHLFLGNLVLDLHQTTAIRWLLLLSALIAYGSLTIPVIRQLSETTDDAIQVTDSFYYWKGDVVSNPRHPPFLAAIQGLALGLEARDPVFPSPKLYSVADRAGEFRRLNPDRYFDWVIKCRWVVWFFGLGIGLLIAYFLSGFGLAVFGVGLFLWALDPTLGAFSTQSLADVPSAFWFLAALLFHQKSAKPRFTPGIFQGLLVAAAVTTKFHTAFLIPWLGASTVLRKDLSTGGKYRYLAGMMAGLALGTALVYLPGTLAIPDHPNPLRLMLLGFQDLHNLYREKYPLLFLGVLSDRHHPLYFPAAYLLKNPTTLLLLTAGGLLAVARDKSGISPVLSWCFPVFLAFMLPAHNMGVRYLLPIQTIAILLAAETAGRWVSGPGRRRVKWAVLTAGLVFQLIFVIKAAPDLIGYFNESVPPDRRIWLLGDSNLDIGQETYRAAAALQGHHWSNLVALQHSAPALRDLGFNSRPWEAGDFDKPDPERVYVMNAAFAQTAQFYNPAIETILHSWLGRTAPSGHLSDTWWYYRFDQNGRLIQDEPRLKPLDFPELRITQ